MHLCFENKNRDIQYCHKRIKKTYFEVEKRVFILPKCKTKKSKGFDSEKQFFVGKTELILFKTF